MKNRRLNKLNKGDTFKIIALASPLKTKEKHEKIEQCKNRFREFGFNVDIDESVYQENYYQSVLGKVKAEVFEKAVLDNSIYAIMSMRGGYSSVKMLEHLNLDVLDNCNKPIIGYSDLTIVLNYISQTKNLITLHGPMFTTINESDNISYQNLFELLSSDDTTGYKYDSPNSEILVDGRADGKIVGGNLALICSAIGTKFEIDITNNILFIEEIGEAAYSIDRMLTQLKHAKYFDNASGIIFGNFLDCNMSNTEDERGVREIVLDILGDYNKPVIFNFDSGHESEMLTLPIGGQVKIEDGEVIIMENIIRDNNE